MSTILKNQRINVYRFEKGDQGKKVYQAFFRGDIVPKNIAFSSCCSFLRTKGVMVYRSDDSKEYVVEKDMDTAYWALNLAEAETLHTNNESFLPNFTKNEPTVETDRDGEVLYSNERPEFKQCIKIVNTADDLKSAVDAVFEYEEDTCQRLTDLHTIAKNLLELVENVCVKESV